MNMDKRTSGRATSKTDLRRTYGTWWTRGKLYCVLSILTAAALVAVAVSPRLTKVMASSPTAGTLSPAGPSVTWNGLALDYVNPVSANEANCQDGTTCDTFKLTVSGTQADWAGKAIHIEIDWLSPTFDYALSVHKGTNSDPSIQYSDNPIDSPRNWEAVDIDPSVSGVGDYSVHVIYFTTSSHDPYQGTASITIKPSPTPTPTPPPVSTAQPPRFFNYVPPAGMGVDAGEPSIGVNWSSGKVFFQSNTHTLRVTFDDGTSPAATTWVEKSAPNNVTTLDPILFSDTRTSRTFASQLAGATSLMAYTDDDGETWTPTQGAGIPASVDHQTVGGGPLAAPLTRDATSPLYKDAVYYCSQDLGVDASCAVSLDGGLTFGPAVRIYTQVDCDAGLHGHVKVAPDGTAYVPSKGCGGQQAVIVSENNGLTWDIRKIPGSVSGESDPSVGIGSDGTVYFAYANGDGHQRVAVSHDKGKTWPSDLDQDLGYFQGVQNSVFPSAVAGDADRAGVFFLGTSTPGRGAYQDDPSGFTGTWYGYIATTYDGGHSWVTVNATPNDPVQRGPICTQGTLTCTSGTRNLLDFNDLTVDAKGRMLAAYADGCVSALCVQGVDFNADGKLDGNDNDQSEQATIIRLAGGKGLFSQYDVALSSNLPGTPLLVATQDGRNAYLAWSAPDNGGSAITSYSIYRGMTTGETLLATVGGDVNSYKDATYAGNSSFYYRIKATNANGSGALSAKVFPSVLIPTVAESPCKLPGVTVVTDAPGDARLSSQDIRSISVAEPYFTDGSNKLVFTMKVATLDPAPPPNTSWKVYFKAADGMLHFVEMNTFRGLPSYNYGHVDVDPTTGLGTDNTDGSADGTNSTDGTITITVANSLVGNPTAGNRIYSVKGSVQALVGAVVGLLETMDSTGPGVYTLVGNDYCAPRPAAPTGLTAVNTSRSTVTLNWTDNSDNEQRFLIERSTSVNSGFAQIASVNAGVTSFADSSVVRRVTYYYRVRAANGTFMSLYSNVASVNVKK